MKIANLADVKNDLSRYVALVRRGERVRILIRGVPAADLVPIEEATLDDDLALLERDGVVRRGRSDWPRELDQPGPKVRGDAAVQAVLRERREGR